MITRTVLTHAQLYAAKNVLLLIRELLSMVTLRSGWPYFCQQIVPKACLKSARFSGPNLLSFLQYKQKLYIIPKIDVPFFTILVPKLQIFWQQKEQSGNPDRDMYVSTPSRESRPERRQLREANSQDHLRNKMSSRCAAE